MISQKEENTSLMGVQQHTIIIYIIISYEVANTLTIWWSMHGLDWGNLICLLWVHWNGQEQHRGYRRTSTRSKDSVQVRLVAGDDGRRLSSYYPDGKKIDQWEKGRESGNQLVHTK